MIGPLTAAGVDGTIINAAGVVVGVGGLVLTGLWLRSLYR